MGRLHYIQFLLKYVGLVLLKRETIGSSLHKQVKKHPNDIFMMFEEEKHTWDAFNRRVNRRANLFRDLGIGKGDVVNLLMDNRPEFAETLCAMGKLGAVTALINNNLISAPLAHCLNLSGSSKIIVGAECLESLNTVMPKLDRIKPENCFVDTRWAPDKPPAPEMQNLNEMLKASSEANPKSPPLNSKDPLLFIYTSGTTGLPKAARINNYRIHAVAYVMGFFGLALKPGDILYCPLPLYHSNGVLISFGSALVNGASFALSRKFSASRFWDEVKAFQATAFIYIGELLRYLVNTPPVKGETDHKVTRILGNGLRPDIWETFQSRFKIPHIREFYGSTEGNLATVNVNDTPGSVGKSILKLSDNTAIARYDVEKDEHPRGADGLCIRCKPGEVGEMLAGITLLTPFYGYTNKAESDKKLLSNVFKKGDMHFRTGDLMKADEQGNYYFIDRIGDTFRWRGENVATQEVQEVVSGMPGVYLTSVFGVQVPGEEGRVGMAALMMDEGKKFDPKALYAQVSSNLPNFSQPAFVRVVDNMNITGTFKLRKVELQSEAYDIAKVSNPLFMLDREKKTYIPFKKKEHDKLLAKEYRL